ncbi:MAG: peptide chain release factor N(5)-glutamine methyltransferase [Pseudomonadota bacterium]
MQFHSGKHPQWSSHVWLEYARDCLCEAGIADPLREARYLYHAILHADTPHLPPKRDDMLDDADLQRCMAALARRARYEPLAKIIGRRTFWSLDFRINEHVLDPRADSETLIVLALRNLDPFPQARILDVGTGSGCLLLSLLHECPGACGIGCDISFQAIQVAHDNAKRLQLKSRAHFLCSDLVSACKGPFDIVVSNPPYIAHAALATLAPDVRDYDPVLALDGGDDGLDYYRNLAQDCANLAHETTKICVEIGHDQMQLVCTIFQAHRWQLYDSARDLGGKIRALAFTKAH